MQYYIFILYNNFLKFEYKENEFDKQLFLYNYLSVINNNKKLKLNISFELI